MDRRCLRLSGVGLNAPKIYWALPSEPVGTLFLVKKRISFSNLYSTL